MCDVCCMAMITPVCCLLVNTCVCVCVRACVSQARQTVAMPQRHGLGSVFTAIHNVFVGAVEAAQKIRGVGQHVICGGWCLGKNWRQASSNTARP